jgi:hypothetical protein
VIPAITPLTPGSCFVLKGHGSEFQGRAGRGGRDELVATAGNFTIARAAYDTAVSLWPKAVIELRQGARVVQKNGE